MKQNHKGIFSCVTIDMELDSPYNLGSQIRNAAFGCLIKMFQSQIKKLPWKACLQKKILNKGYELNLSICRQVYITGMNLINGSKTKIIGQDKKASEEKRPG
jgi:hypothetical protein